MTDIVERLQNLGLTDQDIDEAVEEIKRLRTALAELGVTPEAGAD